MMPLTLKRWMGVFILLAMALFLCRPIWAEDSEAKSDVESTAAPDAAPIQGTFSPVSSKEAPADQSIVSGLKGLDERVSLDLRNIEVADALRFLAQKGGINLAISKNVSGRVQLLLNDVPIRDILDIILITNNLAYDKYGDVYRIISDAEYKDRFGRKFGDARQVRMFKLKYAIPEQAFSVLEVLKTEIGRLLVDPESGTVLVMDSPDAVARMEQALDTLEQRRTVKTYQLKYAKSTDIEGRLKARLDAKKVGTAAADERTNTITVETLPDRIREIDDIVDALDQKTKEVVIDAKVIRVTIEDNTDAEINWEGMFDRITRYGNAFVSNHPFSPVVRTGQTFIDNFTSIAPTSNPAAGSKTSGLEKLYLGRIDGSDAFEVLIKFLRTLGETKILSNPKIAVTNNQEAKIHVGEKQAYVTTTTTTGQTTTTTAESVTFVDVGIQLAVTPTINDDGFVTVKIKPEISSVVDFLTTPSGNKIPIIDSSKAETQVMVKDGVSIILGGLRKEEKTEDRKKIPFLGDVPILGKPFNSTNKTSVRQELIIIITPHIVYGDKLELGSSIGEKRQPFLSSNPYMGYSDYDSMKDSPVVKPAAVRS